MSLTCSVRKTHNMNTNVPKALVAMLLNVSAKCIHWFSDLLFRIICVSTVEEYTYRFYFHRSNIIVTRRTLLNRNLICYMFLVTIFTPHSFRYRDHYTLNINIAISYAPRRFLLSYNKRIQGAPYHSRVYDFHSDRRNGSFTSKRKG
jgi:hypothetical protein